MCTFPLRLSIKSNKNYKKMTTISLHHQEKKKKKTTVGDPLPDHESPWPRNFFQYKVIIVFQRNDKG
jgi:hypothetical protein